MNILEANEVDCMESGTIITLRSELHNDGEIDVGEIVPLFSLRNNTVGRNIDCASIIVGNVPGGRQSRTTQSYLFVNNIEANSSAFIVHGTVKFEVDATFDEENALRSNSIIIL